MRVTGPSLAARGLILVLLAYRAVFSVALASLAPVLGLLGPSPGMGCRFEPSCSAYALDAVRTRGALVGLALTVRRLARCHPFCRGGLDPVPPRRAACRVPDTLGAAGGLAAGAHHLSASPGLSASGAPPC
jgi:hypothetical protein